MAFRLLFLNGLAILMIPLQHASAYGLQAMFQWTNRYRDVVVPNYDLLYSVPYYVATSGRQLSTFAVPAFMFISAYFVAFMASGRSGKVTYSSLLPRIKTLIPPFLIWTVIRYIMLRRPPESVDEVLSPYHFVPIIIQWYLLAPFLVPLAKRHWKLLLLVAAILQFGFHAARYLNHMGVEAPIVDFLVTISPRWVFYGQQPFWFPLGLVVGIHFSQISPRLRSMRWLLLTGTIIFGALTVVEYEVVDRLTGSEWIGPTFSGFSREFYIFCFLMTVMSFTIRANRGTKLIGNIGTKSLGIYMANIPAIYLVALILYYATPVVLSLPILYLTILALAGLLLPLGLMWIFRNTRLRKVYHYTFG